ncbi:ATP-grasp fold amidoligase family protein [Salinicoccus albus]|uniref:ATP-grasp fold amidoligase family protein n=1 Tax=Salinicoccus albus TaxID=418756 RepID=UPI00037ECF0A|nr:ATP-grasp fold amidoligase family protein [Salinicoccus albus]
MDSEQNNQNQEADHRMMRKLLRKRAQIDKADREKAEAEKRISQIKSSNTWKSSRPLRKLIRKSADSESHHNREIESLRESLRETQKELHETTEALHIAALDDRAMNSIKIQNLLRTQMSNAALIGYIEKAVKQKQQHDENYNQALAYAGRLFMNEDTASRQAIYDELLKALKIEDIPEYMIREGLTEDPLPLDTAASFRGSLNMRMRQKQLSETLPEWLLDEKQAAFDFADQLNIKRPWTSAKPYKISELPKVESVVIKPADGAGSRGVYIVYDLNDIIDVKRSRKLTSWEALIQSMKEDLSSGRVNDDRWNIEELIMEDRHNKIPATDIKFYSFYGKVGLVLEIIRYPELKYCWWTPEGQRVHTGKYEAEPFKGKGVTPQEVDLASGISAQIPAPFIRVDFLRSENSLVFGEFTPKPGNYDGFDTRTDRWMGDCFLKAQGRLEQDLLNHKAFTAFMELKNRYHR